MPRAWRTCHDDDRAKEAANATNATLEPDSQLQVPHPVDIWATVYASSDVCIFIGQLCRELRHFEYSMGQAHASPSMHRPHVNRPHMHLLPNYKASKLQLPKSWCTQDLYTIMRLQVEGGTRKG
jgi:hypothetical protein